MKKITALFLAAALAACALCGCKGTTPANSAPSDETTASSGEAAKTEIVVGIPQDLDSLDPYQVGAAGTREVMFNVYEGLVKLNPDGDYVDAVAASHTVSEDGLTYTFTLRDGVKFHNGNEVTADDVLYSFETCAANTVNESVKAAISVAEVSASGKDIIIKLPEMNSDFLAYVSNVYITPAGYTDHATAPMGTGPFKFSSYKVQDSFVVVRNDDYYGTLPALTKVTFKIFASQNDRLNALQAGSIDLATHLTSDHVAVIPDTYTIMDGTMNLAVALYLNNAQAPFDNEKVRQALWYAIDIDNVMNMAAGGGVKIGSSMFPAFGKYFDASLADKYSYDPAKAKELLKEAGYENGFTFKITYATEYEHPYGDMAAVIKEDLAKVGITAELDPIEWSSWLSDVYQGRNFETTLVGFDTSVLTASGMLQRWTSEAGKNMINFKNAEYDETFAKALASAHDDELQTSLFKRCLEILNETAANVYIEDLPEYVAINPAFTGYEFYPLYILDMSTVRPAQ